MREPQAPLTKKGRDPTDLNARTGLLTPPGMYLKASSKSLFE